MDAVVLFSRDPVGMEENVESLKEGVGRAVEEERGVSVPDGVTLGSACVQVTVAEGEGELEGVGEAVIRDVLVAG